jgi:hypothetical protein
VRNIKFAAVGRDLYLDLPLTETILNYRPMGMVADVVAPIVEVNKQSGSVIEWSQADLLRVENDMRAPGTQAKQITIGVSSQTYYCNNYALKAPVTLEDIVNADAAYRSMMFEGRAMRLTDKLGLNWENRVASMVGSTSNVGSNAAVSSIWTGSGADPIADVNTGIDNVHGATGYRPNRAWFGRKAWNAFRRHSTVRNLIFGTNNGGGYPSTQGVADLLELEFVHVGMAFKNTADEAIAKSLSNVLRADAVLIYYAPARPSIEAPSFMYTYRTVGNGIPNMQVERHPFDQKTKSEEIEVGYYQDELITSKPLSFLVTSAA